MRGPTKGRPFFKLILSPSFCSERKKRKKKGKITLFFWDYNCISVTMNSSAYKINNNSNLNFFFNSIMVDNINKFEPKTQY